MNNSTKLAAGLPAELFEIKKNEEVVHQTLKWFLASKRAGTHSALTRAEVSGGGKKPWKQKGTGRARAGTIRSPLWRHGGVIFGPKPRDYSFALPKKVRQLALKIVLSDKAREGQVRLVDDISVDKPKTKSMLELIGKLGLSGSKVLFVASKISDNLDMASRNLEKIKIVRDQDLNIFDLLNADTVVIDNNAVLRLKELLV
ncbi:50S ribosomal protein L4 [Candidatus Saganbacteria bacterium]|nr:50S ribosomal protein L4 [Candidatus Saganbacteria bacterium]